MKKILFIDRDGTIIAEPPDEQIDSFEKFSFLPGAITNLAAIARETDYELVMVTNQDGLGTPSFPEETFWPVQNKMLEILSGEGVEFTGIFIDRTLPSANAPTRKPGTAMLTSFLAKGVDMNASYVIGDRHTDIQLAKNLGCKAIYISEFPSDEAALTTTSWNEIYSFLTKSQRKAEVKRKTKETDIFVSVNLDGTGKSKIETGIGFFNHMLEQISRHGDIDLTIQAIGDLHVDPHHTTEDVGIALGEALLKALGGKKGIERYSFVLPMDDSLAQVALDFGGRPWMVWDVNFGNKMIGEMPSEMLFHFFKSLSDNAKCNLNIKSEGDNDHHIAEAIFKAFARALKAAVRQTGDYRLPTTKGKL